MKGKVVNPRETGLQRWEACNTNGFMHVMVQPLVGAVCLTVEDGMNLHDAYRSDFNCGEQVVLDFAGTRLLGPQFFNTAIGLLLKDYSVEEVRNRLKIRNLPLAGVAPLRQSMQNSERYFHDANFQAALDRVMVEVAAEV